MLGRFIQAVVLLAILTVLLNVPMFGLSPQPALACSVGAEEYILDRVAQDSSAIAIVRVVEVQGSENLAPPVSSPPPGYPRAPTQARSIDAEFDLQGYGARVELEETWTGTLPTQLELDISVRKDMEQGLRLAEIGFVTPCPIDMLATKYAAGERYLVFLVQENSGWRTRLAYEIQDDEILIRSGSLTMPMRWQLLVSERLWQMYFPTIPVESLYPSEATGLGPLGNIFTVTSNSVSLTSVRQAVNAAGMAAISPPDTGNGGLLQVSLE